MAVPIGGQPTMSSESSQVAWIDPGNLDELHIHPSMRTRLTHFLTSDDPHID
jgi:hypothetical protein